MRHLTVDVRLGGASGIGRYLSHVLPGVAAAGPFRTTLIAAPEPDPRLPPWPPAATIVESDAPVYSLAEQRSVYRSIPRDTDLFWSPHYNVPVAYRGRMIVTIHDVLHLARPEFVRAWHQRLYAKAMFRAAVRKPEIILCDSEFTANELVRLAGAVPARLRVIHLGVEDEWFRPRNDALTGDRPHLIFVGNVKPHKNVSGLLQAFALIASEIPHDLIIVGKREGFITGDVQVAQLASNLGSRVRFTGPIADDELRRLLAGSLAMVFPSLYEGFGLPPLEAMAAGCPTVVSRVASLPEVCGEASLYCDPTDPADIARQMLRIVREAGLREELIGRGRERARAFTWSRCVEQTVEAISEALS